MNLQIKDDIHVGGMLQSENGEFKKAHVQAMYQNIDKEDTNMWVRSDLMRKWLGLGFQANHGVKCSHIIEAFYGFGEESAKMGPKEKPMWLRLGARYVLSDRSHVTGNYLIGGHFEKDVRYVHKLDDNWSFSCHYHKDTRRQNSKNLSQELGYSLSYNC